MQRGKELWAMAERKRIFLIRHGTPESRDEEKRYIGWTDLPLSRQGRKEARQLGHCFAQRLPDAPFRILTSPLARCRSTAMEICQGLSEEGGSPPTPVVVISVPGREKQDRKLWKPFQKIMRNAEPIWGDFERRVVKASRRPGNAFRRPWRRSFSMNMRKGERKMT